MAYWEDRIAKSQSNVYKKTKKEIDEQLSKYYAATAKQVIEDFENTYLKLLDTIGKDKEPTPADLYKLDKYWKLQAQLRKELQKLGEKEVALLTKQFENEFFNVYDELALEGLSSFNSLDTDSVSQIINQVWCADRKSWSERIWENTELLAETLNEQLIHTVASGRKTPDLKKLLQERFKVSYSRADSLVRTELAHIQTEAAKKRYEDYGIKEVEVLADEDERRCDTCGKLHGKRFPIGANIPIPAHPCCRCCIVPVVEDNLTNKYEDDIIIGRSLGASAKNYPVKDIKPSQQHFKFAEGTSITHINVIMGDGTKYPLNDKYAIALRNNIKNPAKIQKMQGQGIIVAKGQNKRVLLHWYRAEGKNFEFKVKEYLK